MVPEDRTGRLAVVNYIKGIAKQVEDDSARLSEDSTRTKRTAEALRMGAAYIESLPVDHPRLVRIDEVWGTQSDRPNDQDAFVAAMQQTQQIFSGFANPDPDAGRSLQVEEHAEGFLNFLVGVVEIQKARNSRPNHPTE